MLQFASAIMCSIIIWIGLGTYDVVLNFFFNFGHTKKFVCSSKMYIVEKKWCSSFSNVYSNICSKNFFFEMSSSFSKDPVHRLFFLFFFRLHMIAYCWCHHSKAVNRMIWYYYFFNFSKEERMHHFFQSSLFFSWKRFLFFVFVTVAVVVVVVVNNFFK